MATLLVIGGTGFFGKSILDLFQRGGLAPWGVDHVIAMARQAERLRVDAPQLLSEQVTLLSADIASVDALPAAEYVIHAAASTDARNYLRQPLTERRNIQAGTLNYCRLARLAHRHSQIVFVSSGAVYGVQPAGLEQMPEEYADADVASLPDGKRDYAIAKRDAEQAIRELGHDGCAVSIARCFAFVGQWLPRDQHFAIGNFIGDALAGRPVVVKARHRVYRSYMYADDLVEWLMTIAADAGTACPTFNVGSDQSIMMGPLAEMVAAACGQQAEVPAIDSEQVDRYVPAIRHGSERLGLTIKYDLRAALHETLQRIATG